MEKGVVLAMVLLLAVPAVFALGTADSAAQCRTRSDCAKLLLTANPVCGEGFMRNYASECVQGKCNFCMPTSTRIKLDCRLDIDCTAKKTCTGDQVAQCMSRKCVCAPMLKPQCYTNNDCTRKYLGNAPEKLVCMKNKCVKPQPKIIMLPWRAKPLNYTSALPVV
jgi:hypothetical protein